MIGQRRAAAQRVFVDGTGQRAAQAGRRTPR